MTMFPLPTTLNRKLTKSSKSKNSQSLCMFFLQRTTNLFLPFYVYLLNNKTDQYSSFYSILKWFFSLFSSFEIRLQSTLISMKLNQYSNQIIVMYILYFTIHLSRLKQICDSEVRNSFFFSAKFSNAFSFVCLIVLCVCMSSSLLD